jgi:O-antigen/teichoic acid export membrane protein
VSSAFVVLVGIAIALGALFALAYGRVDWARVFNVDSVQARREAGPATAAFVVCFLFNLPLGIVARIRPGYQEGYRTSFYDAAGHVLGLLLVLLAIAMHAPLVWLVVAMAGAPVLASAVHAAVLFGRDRPWLRVSLAGFDGPVAKRLLHHGLLFFALHLAASLIYVPDNIIVAQLRGAESVARFAVVAKLFSVSILLADVTLGPLWPAYGEALARGDRAWVHDTLWRSIRLALVTSAALAALLVAAGNSILTVWVGPEMVAPASLLLGLGAWTGFGAVGTAVAMYLNAANRMGVQVACAAVMVPASLALKVALVDRLGLAGVPWGLVIAYVAFVGVPLAVLARRGRLTPR